MEVCVRKTFDIHYLISLQIEIILVNDSLSYYCHESKANYDIHLTIVIYQSKYTMYLTIVIKGKL